MIRIIEIASFILSTSETEIFEIVKSNNVIIKHSTNKCHLGNYYFFCQLLYFISDSGIIFTLLFLIILILLICIELEKPLRVKQILTGTGHPSLSIFPFYFKGSQGIHSILSLNNSSQKTAFEFLTTLHLTIP